MTWRIGFSKEAVSFLKRDRRLSEADAVGLIEQAVRMFGGERLNVDIKKLKGEWMGFHRIRKGSLRVIVAFDFGEHSALIERIDWRGGAYK